MFPIRGFGWLPYKLTGGRLSRSGYKYLRSESKKFVKSLTRDELRYISGNLRKSRRNWK